MVDPVASPLREGDVVGEKYRLERVIAGGGMGVLWAGTHVELGQRVALKVLQEKIAREPAAVERFRREARAVGRLRSEHVVRVMDVGRLAGGEPFMVMELLAGEDLADILAARAPLSVDEVVDWTLQACDAIAEAHAEGIVHRDLKPRNLFLATQPNGQRVLKVLDFGISKVSGDGEARSLTGTNDVMGSPQYMAPEQVRGSKDVDARTDVWALGVVMYELLAGTPPFDGDTVPVICAQILEQGGRPLGEARPELPAALVAIIARCMAKAPADRYASIRDLMVALKPFAPTGARGALLPVPSQPSVVVVAKERAPRAPGATSISWADTVLAGAPKRGPWIAAAGLVAVAAAFFMGRGTSERAPASPLASTAPSASEAIAPSVPVSAPASIVPLPIVPTALPSASARDAGATAGERVVAPSVRPSATTQPAVSVASPVAVTPSASAAPSSPPPTQRTSPAADFPSMRK